MNGWPWKTLTWAALMGGLCGVLWLFDYVMSGCR